MSDKRAVLSGSNTILIDDSIRIELQIRKYFRFTCKTAAFKTAVLKKAVLKQRYAKQWSMQHNGAQKGAIQNANAKQRVVPGEREASRF